MESDLEERRPAMNIGDSSETNDAILLAVEEPKSKSWGPLTQSQTGGHCIGLIYVCLASACE